MGSGRAQGLRKQNVRTHLVVERDRGDGGVERVHAGPVEQRPQRREHVVHAAAQRTPRRSHCRDARADSIGVP